MYKLTNHNSIIRLADNACIPFAEGNTDYAKYLQDIEADPTCVLPADPLPDPIIAWRESTEVSRFQARAALHYAEKLEAINTYMLTADLVQQMAWNTAQVFKRMSTTVLALQPLLELSDEQLDDLFKFALTIEA